MTISEKLTAPLLLVEDNDDDYIAMMRALDQAGINVPLFRCSNGDDALDYLNQSGRYLGQTNLPRPSLILLDLNLPGTDGREVLRTVKQDSQLASIPVIVMTTSSNPNDVIECYQHGANGYQVKTSNYEGFKREIRNTVHYWFETAVLPAMVESA